VDTLAKNFGGVKAVRDLSFEVSAGEILGLIGPNGSGKSTTVNVLAGVFPATSGSILLAGQPM
jgi:branched-chain amino acid transport system ATP-binding protein